MSITNRIIRSLQDSVERLEQKNYELSNSLKIVHKDRDLILEDANKYRIMYNSLRKNFDRAVSQDLNVIRIDELKTEIYRFRKNIKSLESQLNQRKGFRNIKSKQFH